MPIKRLLNIKPKKKKVAIFGIGNFGFAILKHLDKYKSKDYEIHAYDIDHKLLENLKKHRTHTHLHKNIKISKNITFSENLENTLKNCDILILAIASKFTKEVILNIKDKIKRRTIILNTSKALDFDSGKRISQIVAESLKPKRNTYAIMAGGTIAKDLFKHEPLGIDIASKSPRALKKLKELMQSPTLKVFTTKDLKGVEYVSAFKNIIAIFSGIIQGSGFSYGSETYFISRFSLEIKQLVTRELKGRSSSFKMETQSWGNDLWMSCTGNTRNKEFGVLIGKKNSVAQAINIFKKEKKLAEGINSIKCLNKITTKLSKYPLLNATYRIVEEKEPIKKVMKDILNNNNK